MAMATPIKKQPQVFSKGETEMIRIPKAIKADVLILIDRERARKLNAMARKYEEASK